MSELFLRGRLLYSEAPIVRHDKWNLPMVTEQPPAGAQNTTQVFVDLANHNPGTSYMLALNPDGSVRAQNPVIPASAGPVGPQRQQTAGPGISAERLRQWLLGIRLKPSPFPTVGSQ